MIEFEVNRTVALDELTDDLITQLFTAAQQNVTIPSALTYSIGIVDDDVIARLNEQYRHKRGPTDVLSFRYTDTTAEIVISAPRARQQAAELGHSVAQEAAWLLVHGILHTLGWDHERSKQEARDQRSKEIEILRLCGLDSAR